MEIQDLSFYIVALGALTVVVNIITEVIKKTMFNHTVKEHTVNLMVGIVSILVTVAAFACCSFFRSGEITWYSIIASIVAGFFVAYSAMFGYDKLKEALAKIKK